MSSRRSRVYDSSKIESDGMLVRHPEALQQREKRGAVEVGGCFKIQKLLFLTKCPTVLRNSLLYGTLRSTGVGGRT